MSNSKLSFIISSTYTLLGTLYACYYWTGISFGSIFLHNLLFAFFAPVAFIPIGIIFAEANPTLYIFISQIIAFFISWLLIYAIVSLFRKPSKKIKITEQLDSETQSK